jgi:hypothetical protein
LIYSLFNIFRLYGNFFKITTLFWIFLFLFIFGKGSVPLYWILVYEIF